MANFCTNCGRQLNDGEVCNCTANTINNNQFDRNNIALNIDSATDMTIVGNRFDRSIEYHITLRVSGATIVGNKFFKRYGARLFYSKTDLSKC